MQEKLESLTSDGEPEITDDPKIINAAEMYISRLRCSAVGEEYEYLSRIRRFEEMMDDLTPEQQALVLTKIDELEGTEE